MDAKRPLRVLFFVEGFTDIRFVSGLSRICELTLAVPRGAYRDSGLAERVRAAGLEVRVDEIDGGRLRFQAASLAYLWRRVREFDVVLSQEVLRGSLNATLVGRLRGVPVLMHMGVSPLEYFRCRRERRLVGPLTALAGSATIAALMRMNGRLATGCLAVGPYLREVALRFCPRTEMALAYGVDTDVFRPATPDERAALRARWGLPVHRFVLFLSSRMSHEKDPETVIRAVQLARRRGIDAVLVNASGGYAEFLALTRALGVPRDADWVIGRPPVHPVTEVADLFRAADVAPLASRAEGLGMSPLEALACGTPVVATAVGGMARALLGYAHLTPARDPVAMADAISQVAADPGAARARALEGRRYVEREWSSVRAFAHLRHAFAAVVEGRRP